MKTTTAAFKPAARWFGNLPKLRLWTREAREGSNLKVCAIQRRFKMSGQTLTYAFKTLLCWCRLLHSCTFHLENLGCFLVLKNYNTVSNELVCAGGWDLDTVCWHSVEVVGPCWTGLELTEEKYPNMRKHATSLTAFFSWAATFKCSYWLKTCWG